MPIRQINLPKIIAHRGASAIAPENTLAAFDVAVEKGAEWVEFDVRLTHDKGLVVFHDERLERTTNGTGLVRDHTLAELSALDAGSWFSKRFRGEGVPDFRSLLDFLIEHNLSANVETKSSIEDCELITWQTIAVLRQSGIYLDKVLLSSFEIGSLIKARQLSDEISIGLLFEELPGDWLELARSVRAYSVHLDERYLTQAIVEAVKGSGFKVLAYTVNDKERADQLFEMGVSSVFSDALLSSIE